MNNIFNYTFDNERPIYLQIVDIITNEIISGVLKPGEKINSVREYALIMKANPNTIVKALAILEDKKLIITERTNGKFVTSDLSIIQKYKENIFLERVDLFLKEIDQMGYTKEEVIKILKEKKI
jgi:DNA-binding transcriptional regulator YhcF (GntR family)